MTDKSTIIGILKQAHNVKFEEVIHPSKYSGVT